MSKKDRFSGIRKLIEESRYIEAVAELNRIIEVEKRNHEAYIIKAGVLQLMEKQDEAIDLYKYVMQLFPNDPEAYLELISVLSVPSKKTEETNKEIIELCRKVESIDERKAPFYILAKAYDDLSQNQLALQTYDRAIKQEAIHIRACSTILKEYKTNKNMIDLTLEEIDKRSGTLLWALRNKAFRLKQIAEFEESEGLYRTVKFQEAIDTYKIVTELNILRNREYESYLDYESISEIYNLMGDYKKSQIYAEKAEKFEKLDRDVYDKSQGRMTDDEFNRWFDNYFEVNEKGEIIGIRKDCKRSI